jgi:voltage-gated potassium channel
MVKKHYNKYLKWIEKRRFSLLLAATFMVLILPAFATKGLMNEILFVFSLSFLLAQSMIVASAGKSKKRAWVRYAIVILMIIIFWMEPIGYQSQFLDSMRLMLLATFFVFVAFYLVKFMRKAGEVNVNVIITAVNLYLLMGIISASLVFIFYKVLPGAYNFPSYISDPNFVNFTYYSFITMSTVGYGDITPRLPQTQTLAYLIAVTGQLYVAIIMAFLVGKLLMHKSENKAEDQ